MAIAERSAMHCANQTPTYFTFANPGSEVQVECDTGAVIFERKAEKPVTSTAIFYKPYWCGVYRIILLSDGLANRGETNPDVIATDVHGLAQRGATTTTLGLGDDYNEDLLEAMARSGDGNYYYVADAEQLPTIFERELQGLAATSVAGQLGSTVPSSCPHCQIFPVEIAPCKIV